MNTKFLLLAASVPMMLSTPQGAKQLNPKTTELEASSFKCENGHFVDDTNVYEMEITNNSNGYIIAASVYLDFNEGEGKHASPLLVDGEKLLIAPSQKMTLTYETSNGPVDATPDVSCFAYFKKHTNCQYEDTLWVSCEKTTLHTAADPEKDWYRYTFDKNSFNYTGTEDVIYTVKLGDESYSFYGGHAKAGHRSFLLDKQVDMSDLEITDMYLIEMENVDGSANADAISNFFEWLGKSLNVAVVFIYILMGIMVLVPVAFIVLITVFIVRSIAKKSRSKKAGKQDK